jgi:hypothetical protein
MKVTIEIDCTSNRGPPVSWPSECPSDFRLKHSWGLAFGSTARLRLGAEDVSQGRWEKDVHRALNEHYQTV